MFTDGIHVTYPHSRTRDTREDRNMLPRLLTVWLLVAAAGKALDAGDIQISHHKYQQRVAIITLHCLVWHMDWGNFLQTSSIIFNE